MGKQQLKIRALMKAQQQLQNRYCNGNSCLGICRVLCRAVKQVAGSVASGPNFPVSGQQFLGLNYKILPVVSVRPDP